MYNDLFSIGPLTIHGYGLMIAIGTLAAFYYAEWQTKKAGLNPDYIFWIAVFCVVIGWTSSKLTYILVSLPLLIEHPEYLKEIGSGFVVYGGIIGGVIGGWLFCFSKKTPYLPYVDIVMPAVALAQGFGRIGCFLAGCCYGIACESPVSVVFTHSDYAPNGVALLPTQLFSSGLDFLHFLILHQVLKRNKQPGRVSAIYLILYSIGRFCIEFLRGDLARGHVGALSTSQFIGIFMVLLGIALYCCAPALYAAEEAFMARRREKTGTESPAKTPENP